MTGEPRTNRTEAVFTRLDWVIYGLLFASNLAAIAWFGREWFSLREMGAQGVLYGITTLGLAYALSVSTFRWLLLPSMRRPVHAPVVRAGRVGVATTFVPGLESLEMLEATVSALVEMDVPHDTWVLDEGDDAAVREMCQRLGAGHFSRRHRAEYQTPTGVFASKTKHGNYNAWLDAEGYARYDVIVGFDPDHVPDRHFLTASLGYLGDPAIGYVQLPQVYYNQQASFIARGAAEETYSYYSATQMASFAFGFPIVTGCHNVHRTSALKAVGGFAAHDADDLLIAVLYRAHGWQGVYVPEVRAWGLTPTDWQGYLRQQLRWSRSVFDIKLRAYRHLAGRLPWNTRVMSFLHGFYYLQEGVLGLWGTAVLMYLLIGLESPRFLSLSWLPSFVVVVAWLTLTDFYRQRFFLQPRVEWGLHLRAQFLRMVKWPYILFGLVDALTGRERPYSVTHKVPLSSRPWMTWPHVVVCAALLAAGLLGRLRGADAPRSVVVTLGLVCAVTLVAVASEMLPQVPPFDAELLAREVAPRRRAARPPT